MIGIVVICSIGWVDGVLEDMLNLINAFFIWDLSSFNIGIIALINYPTTVMRVL